MELSVFPWVRLREYGIIPFRGMDRSTVPHHLARETMDR